VTSIETPAQSGAPGIDRAVRRLAEYSTDASNYREVPQLVAFPRNEDEVVELLAQFRAEKHLPLTARGGGTSVAGNAIGTGAVLDFSRFMNRVLAINPGTQPPPVVEPGAPAPTVEITTPAQPSATVQAGCIMSTLQDATAPYGLRFGPDPSTQNRCSIGGMIGNNACGPHAVAYGRTADNVLELDCIDGQGRRFIASAGDQTFAAVPGLAELVLDNLALIRTEFGRFSRQVSGYSLEHLLPENGSDLAKALVGTEGTCVTVLKAKVKLVPVPQQPNLVVLGYRDMCEAADDVPNLLRLKASAPDSSRSTNPSALRTIAPLPPDGGPFAIEGLDARLMQIIAQHLGPGAVPTMPDGAGWLMIEVGGATPESALANAEAVVTASDSIDSLILPAGPQAARMWSIRADGAGLAGRTLSGQQAWPGWEDSAVLPENLGAYLRDLLALLDRYGLDGVPYGHFGDGCIHMRVDFPLESPWPSVPEGRSSVSKPRHNRNERGKQYPGSSSVFRDFMEDAADLVVKYGGSMSGEHGDGRARSELLGKMYSREALVLMGKFKALFDPENNLNPGIIIGPNDWQADAHGRSSWNVQPFDANLRRPQAAPLDARKPSRHKDGRAKRIGHLRGIEAEAGYNGFSFAEDDYDLTKAAHRCMGVGKCRAGLGGVTGSFMCPSYQATKDEKDVTRGRARVLQEALNGTMVHGLTSPEVLESLDLCLSCKACSSDCPAVVDIARWKSEVLHRKYKGRIRPVDHYVLGWLPRWLTLLSHFRLFVPLINLVLGLSFVKALVLRLGGMDPQRSLMKFARTPFHVTARKLNLPSNSRYPARLRRRASCPRGATSLSSAQGAERRRRRTSKAAGFETIGLSAQDLRPPVVLWTDSFSEGIAPNVPIAAVKVLENAGYHVIVPGVVACCGLTWISTGQLDGARRRLENLMKVLGPYAVNGIPIMGLEPSCTAVLRSDLLDLFPDDQRAKAIAAATHTFAELLTDPATAPVGWQVPDLSDLKAVVQPHCHHHSVLGFAEDEKLLLNAGAQIEVLSGCCGLAGNFGMQKGHYDISVKVAENALLPALCKADNRTEFLADGFSCRTQALQLAGKEGKALVEIIAERIG